MPLTTLALVTDPAGITARPPNGHKLSVANGQYMVRIPLSVHIRTL